MKSGNDCTGRMDCASIGVMMQSWQTASRKRFRGWPVSFSRCQQLIQGTLEDGKTKAEPLHQTSLPAEWEDESLCL